MNIKFWTMLIMKHKDNECSYLVRQYFIASYEARNGEHQGSRDVVNTPEDHISGIPLLKLAI